MPFPDALPNLDADHSDYVKLLKKLRKIPGVKKVFIRSGIRFDYLLADKKNDFLRELCEYHVSGQLKVCAGACGCAGAVSDGKAGTQSI